ncbi:polyhydroxybutyrate depolymerase [Mesorhizobium sp. B2-1-8]|uniref:alpha/beta hydrolase family esterase n=1 Tax=Mesorhizobium sp. B2-1-8 TaxID=2589967 RepID=UPI0015E2852F|nr:PHB depolymerase family esterase [Mesorhizobium sp. B2-1-8]UCI19933.1 polyhydroxybutyrate depolymerase [Mesorhizobium sp. B2-1-8]
MLRLFGIIGLATATLCLPFVAGLAKAEGCGAPQQAGRQLLQFQSGGVERQALVYVPTSYQPGNTAPLVLDLHGSASDSVEQMDRGMWERSAETNGFVAAELQGALAAQPSGWRWNVPGVTGPDGPDDEGYILDAINALDARFCIDKSRVFASGYSGGARMVAQFACDHPGALAAVGLVAGIRAGFPKDGPNGPEPDPATCRPDKPVRIIAFGGLADPVNPFSDGGAAYWKYGVEKARARWAAIGGCQPSPEVDELSGDIERMTYQNCRPGAALEYYTVKSGGHVWPGSANYLRQPKLGKVTFEINATELMWDFFKGHPR